MKIFKLLITIVVIGHLFSCVDNREIITVDLGQRTVLMYMVADNSLSDDLYENIFAVEEGLKAVSTPGTFVIYWDGAPNKVFSVPTLFKYEVYGKGHVSRREVLQTYPEQNSALPEVMQAVLSDTKRACPAENYGLIFSSHANGWLPIDYRSSLSARSSRAIGQDKDGVEHLNDWMNVTDFSNVLKQSGLHFDYILLDVCLMSQVEVAYELRERADYLIASPAEVLSQGFPYKQVTPYLMSTENVESNVIQVAKTYVDSYRQSSFPWATVAVIKMAEMERLAASTRELLEKNKERLPLLQTENNVRRMQSTYGYGRSPLDYSTYDFKAFIDELTHQNTPDSFNKQLEQTIIFKDYVDKYFLVNIDPKSYSGIGCYLPNQIVSSRNFSNWNAFYSTLSWTQAVYK